jgi:hypothetical protein
VINLNILGIIFGNIVGCGIQIIFGVPIPIALGVTVGLIVIGILFFGD